MSVDSTTLERATLERKDREELTAIARALGGKPPSRARKAEIVQLILELTGVEANAQAAGSAITGEPGRMPFDEPATPGESRTQSVDNGAASQPSEPTEAAVNPSESDESASQASETAESSASPAAGSEDEPPAEWERTFAGRSATPDDAAGREPSSTQSSADGRSAERQQPKADGRGQEPAPTPSSRGGQSPSGGADKVDANEPGNRRRRRRGRRGGGEQQTQVEEFTGEPVAVEGFLDLRDEGYGFLRVRSSTARPSKEDIYVSVKQVRQFGLRKGDHVKGASRPALRNEKNPALLRIDLVNGDSPDQARARRRFEDLTPLFPDERLRLETPGDGSNMTARIVDILSPIGKGQRGLIVSPPKAGKTTIMKQIARSIETNNPEVKLIVLLVDERPEEVTDMRRWLRNPNSEAVASTFDRPAEEHTQVAELTIERAKRMVEAGKDVCIILDGITRLARAYNLAAPATGRIMSGGVDSGALYPPKKFFGAARNVEEGGSLTILATALIETGSRMDEVIFEEFKGTGNMELRLDRRLAERRIYPAIDVEGSSTRHEELLYDGKQLNLAWALRRVLLGLSSGDGGNAAALELLMDRMKTFSTNDQFLAEVAKNRLATG